MRTHVALAAAVGLLLLTVGCVTQPPADAPAVDAPTDEAPATTSLDSLALTIDDLPRGGWSVRADTSDAVSSDSESAGPCALDVADILGANLGDEEAWASFTRESLDQFLTVGVMEADDAVDAIGAIDEAWSACPERFEFVANGQDASVALSDFEGAAPADSVCRHLSMSIGYATLVGDICFVAHDEYIYSAHTYARYSHNAVDPEELVETLAAQAAKLD